MVLGIFEIALRLRNQQKKFVTMAILNGFNKQVFWKNKNLLFKKLEYSLLLESTSIENKTFLYTKLQNEYKMDLSQR